MIVMFSGTFKALPVWKPAWSHTITTCTSGSTSCANCWKFVGLATCCQRNGNSRKRCCAGNELPALPTPPKQRRKDQFNGYLSTKVRTTLDTTPRRAQTRLSVPCWPNLTSSWNHTSLRLPDGLWTCSPPGPDAPQRTLLAKPHFILEPHFDSFAGMVCGDFVQHFVEPFLKASWA